MGPLWDFDTIMETEGKWSACRYYASVYYHVLVERQPFMDAYYALWDSLSNGIVAQLNGKDVTRQLINYRRHVIMVLCMICTGHGY